MRTLARPLSAAPRPALPRITHLRAVTPRPLPLSPRHVKPAICGLCGKLAFWRATFQARECLGCRAIERPDGRWG